MQSVHHHPPSQKTTPFALMRRGSELGVVTASVIAPTHQHRQQWQQPQATLLPNIVHEALTSLQRETEQAYQKMVSIIEGESPSQLLKPIETSQATIFDLTTISADSHDQQAIEKIYFQGYDGNNAIGEVWCKASWLSFYDEDASLRFRFSFGTEGIEDVAANPAQQQLAAELCQQIFPESAAITENPALLTLLQQTLEIDAITFVERIVYFNAPNGGALFHHDVEPGHAGVIYAQVSGSTFWLALSKAQLIDALTAFISQHNISLPFESRAEISAELNRPEHPEIEAIIDHNPQFIQQLIAQGYGYTLHAGDAILLPQKDEECCVWHSVFCLGDAPGEGLSFAMRAAHTLK